MKTAEYLDAVKNELGVTSDYALQKPLRVTKQAISNYRTGRSSFDGLVCQRVAAILGLDVLQVIADMEIERASSPELRALWQRIRAAAVFAFFSVGAALLAPAPAHAAIGHNLCATCPEYTLRNFLRWARRLLGAR